MTETIRVVYQIYPMTAVCLKVLANKKKEIKKKNDKLMHPTRDLRGTDFSGPLPQDSVPRPPAHAEIYLIGPAKPPATFMFCPAPARKSPHKSNLYRFFCQYIEKNYMKWLYNIS